MVDVIHIVRTRPKQPCMVAAAIYPNNRDPQFGTPFIDYSEPKAVRVEKVLQLRRRILLRVRRRRGHHDVQVLRPRSKRTRPAGPAARAVTASMSAGQSTIRRCGLGSEPEQ